MEDEHPCPHVATEADHLRSFINGTGVGLALMLLLNAGSIYRYLTASSSAKSKSRFSAANKSSSSSAISGASTNGSEVDQAGSTLASSRRGELAVRDASYKLNPLDHLIGAVLVGIMLINIYTRVTRGVGHWLVQVLPQPSPRLQLFIYIYIYLFADN
jgi:hypothetical protein